MIKDLMLVGSIPLDTAEDVFKTFGADLGEYLSAVPDGEIGLRRHWISKVHFQVMAAHPDFEVLRHPAHEHGVERQNPRNAGDSWLFQVKDGIDQVRFGDRGWRLGYARDAINSYFVFKTLRDKSVLHPDIRFQVSIPSVNSVITPRVFPRPGDLEKIRPGYEDAVLGEVEVILEKIPGKDLIIQWDCATELQEAYGGIDGFDPDIVIERNVAQFRRLCPSIPADVGLGFHFCFGTLGGWPRFAPDDLSGAVLMANAIIQNAGRHVDWIHLPILDTSEDKFFAPLQGLRMEGTKVYLGMIHNMSRFVERLEVARTYLPEFGLGAFCGFGRESPSKLPGILADHLKAAELAGF
ncbi:MAG: hypothetical protein CFH41_02416 [Alphaproteobacteria bacterium MarineAlpha11_Bin1]|nr:MAG: hypothetical protein CFH41_02416 [Alphaproteobacteria bacterium MarineAlpha11_Bin1]|tara:strand:- start:19119 stop:20174 length:1056 start_codon:yes stop_codon:yes gene_type:complete